MTLHWISDNIVRDRVSYLTLNYPVSYDTYLISWFFLTPSFSYHFQVAFHPTHSIIASCGSDKQIFVGDLIAWKEGEKLW